MRALASMLAVGVVLAGAAGAGRPGCPARSFEVQYASRPALSAALAAAGPALVRVVSPLRVAEVHATARQAARLRASRGIESVRPTTARREAGAPALTLGQVSTPAGGAYEWQWYAAGVDRVPADVLAAAARTKIAVVDTGADVDAPSLTAKVVRTSNVAARNSSVDDTNGHGTFVASIAAGAGDVAGFGGAARLIVVKVADGPEVSDVAVAAGIVRSVDLGARIVNVSIAGTKRSQVEEAAVAYASRHGALVVAAAGNDALNGDPPEYPAALFQPSTHGDVVGLAVGASNMEGARAPFSEHGAYLSIAAPGANVFGAVGRRAAASFARVGLPGATAGTYGFASGTSYAAPQVAGAAALVWAVDPNLTVRQVIAILEETASGNGRWTPDLGYGVLDAGAAVAAAANGA